VSYMCFIWKVILIEYYGQTFIFSLLPDDLP